MALACASRRALTSACNRALTRERPQRLVRAFQVRALKEDDKEQQNRQQGLQRQEAPGPSSLARAGDMPRLPSLFREIEREMDALSRGFFGSDILMRSPFDMLSAFRDLPALTPELDVGMPAMRLATDVVEKDNAYELRADIPGLTKEDIKIKLTPDRVLQISGERKEENVEEREGGRRVERRFGRFQRAFVLPQNTDDAGIKAEAKDGVLCVTIPKTTEPEQPPTKEIPIA